MAPALSTVSPAAALRSLVVRTSVQRPSTWSPDITLIERAVPGTLLSVSVGGQAPVKVVANAAGLAAIPASLGVGRTVVAVTATNGANQSRVSHALIVRSALPNLLRAAAPFVGMSFQPYVKQWTSTKQLAAFNSYGSGNASVKNQLALIAPFYNKVATYSAGYAGYYPLNQPFNKLDSNWQVASAAAQLNAEKKTIVMSVSQGIYQQTNPDNSINTDRMNAEINDAFAIVADANKTYAKTVTRLIFTNEYVTNAATTTAVDGLIVANKAKAKSMGLQVGVRSQTFGQLTDPTSPYLSQMQKLVKDCDFIMLNLYPSKQSVQQGIAASVKNVTDEYQRIKAAALKVNPNLQVLMGETGWPSQGISFNDLSGKSSTVANEKAYMAAFAQWANTNKVESYPFEAIDEPWKSNQKQAPNTGNPWQGPNGAEGHFGLWTYNSPNDTGKFIPK